MWVQVDGDRYSVTQMRRWRDTPTAEMSTEVRLDKPLRSRLRSLIEDASEGFLVGLVLNESGYCKYETSKED